MGMRASSLLLFLSLLLLSACATLVPKDYLLTHEQLERAWGRSFPLHRELSRGLFSTTLATPEVAFLSAQNRISLGMNFSVSSLFGGNLQGHIALTGALRYDAEQRALYLHDTNLETLKVDQGSVALGETLRPALNMMFSEYLRANPLYQFKQDEMRYAGMVIDISGIEVVENGIKLNIKPR